VLGATVCIEIEFTDELLAQMSAAALGENGVLAEQFVARGKAAFLLAFLADTHVASCDAAHGTVFIVQDLRRCKARKNIHAHVFCLLAEPATQVSQTDGVIAFVVRIAGNEKAGHLDAIGVVDHVVDEVFGYRVVERGTAFCPVREQLVQRGGFKDRTRQNVSADFRAFFNQTNREFLAAAFAQLHQAASRREACWTAADNDHVKFHGFALYWLFHCSVIPLISIFIKAFAGQKLADGSSRGSRILRCLDLCPRHRDNTPPVLLVTADGPQAAD